MTLSMIAQLVFNVAVLAAFSVVFIRLNRPQKDDPRMSRGLQLLSSKIAVLEDLNDRTEKQVAQMLELIDAKARELQTKLKQSEQQIQAIQTSMDRSLEVAQIFQDRIPHDEIIERQNTLRYITAARMAHAGQSVDQIAKEVDLPRGEIEFIVKVNKDQLSFREEELPAWARAPQPTPTGPEVAKSLAPAQSPEQSLRELGERFRQASL